MAALELRIIGTQKDIEEFIELFRASNRVVFEGRYLPSRKNKAHKLKYIGLSSIGSQSPPSPPRKGR